MDTPRQQDTWCRQLKRVSATKTSYSPRVARQPRTPTHVVVSSEIPSLELALAVVCAATLSTVLQPFCCGGHGDPGSAQVESGQQPGGKEQSEEERRARPQRVRLADSISVATSDYRDLSDSSSDDEDESLFEYTGEEIPQRRSSVDLGRDYINPVFFQGCETLGDGGTSDDESYGSVSDGGDGLVECGVCCSSLSLVGRYSLRRSFE